jgi:hypothetical protein
MVVMGRLYRLCRETLRVLVTGCLALTFYTEPKPIALGCEGASLNKEYT